MLRELHITNLAVIEDLTVEFGEGLNCFTGQTGAGKSLILGAFETLLGLRAANAAEMMRPGAEEARVSGVFEVHDAAVAREVEQLLDTACEVGEALLITRKLFASGRSSLSVNGQPATASMVRGVGELLVDIHGQHDHQYLLKPSNQLTILDAFGKSSDLREQYATLYHQRRELVEQRDDLRTSGTLRTQQLDLYEFQADEIDAADLVPGEYDELRARHELLSNLGRIKRDTGTAYDALYETEGSIVERLQMLVHVLNDVADMDADLAEIVEPIRSSTLALQESAYDLARYAERLDLNPGELQEVEERLNIVNRLIAKYGSNHEAGNDEIARVLHYREQIGQQIDTLRGQDADSAAIDERIASLEKQLKDVGKKLSKARHTAAEKIKPLVEKELATLGMAEAELHVEFEPAPDGGGPAGDEAIEVMIRTNPGQPARPLRKIASGGELSRVMLALKSILAQSDRISVLVFDEIDANIGGRMGTVIGDKLRALCHGRKTGKKSTPGSTPGQQVLCITHLPQIAAYADRHFRIAKTVSGKGKDRSTVTTVTQLDGPQRIDELAEMLAGTGATSTTRKQVEEMLEAAGA
jgi:DNA repair protein RecN (Recombination protein N)